jgi:hypothetical protein
MPFQVLYLGREVLPKDYSTIADDDADVDPKSQLILWDKLVKNFHGRPCGQVARHRSPKAGIVGSNPTWASTFCLILFLDFVNYNESLTGSNSI